MPVSIVGLNQGLDTLKARLKYIGLVGSNGVELSGGNPAYARQAVTWDESVGGSMNIDGNAVFNVPAGSTVTGWQVYDNATGGTAFGITALPSVTYTVPSTLILAETLTGISLIFVSEPIT